MLDHDPADLDESWRKLQHAEALRDARLIVEARPGSDELSCAICEMKLSESAAVARARLAAGENSPPRPVFSSPDGRTWVCNPCYTEYHKLVDWRVESPYMRQLHSPVTADQLTPLDPRCRIVQFMAAIDRPFTDADFRLMSEFMSEYPDVAFRVYGSMKNLEFLRYFPFARKFQVDVWDLESLDGLRFLPPDLEVLAVGSTKSKAYSLRFLELFPALKRLYLEGHRKDFAVVGTLAKLESLTLRSITLPDLSMLRGLSRLDSLAVKLGSTTDLGLLPKIGKLRYLELWMIRGLTDLGPIAELDHLQYLFLQALKQVTALPSFSKLRSLRRVELMTMKGLQDLSPIAEAPALEELIVEDTRQLTPEAFRPFLGHPTLGRALIALGSRKKNREASALLGLPKVEGKFVFTPPDPA